MALCGEAAHLLRYPSRAEFRLEEKIAMSVG